MFLIVDKIFGLTAKDRGCLMLKLNPDGLMRMLFPSFKCLHYHRLWLHFATVFAGLRSPS